MERMVVPARFVPAPPAAGFLPVPGAAWDRLAARAPLTNGRPRVTASARHTDDAELMARIEAGDPDAVELLYERHASAVLALCLRILRDRAEAEDVLEEVFWELWQRRDRYDRERASPFSYLMTLSRSRALDRLRFRRRRQGIWHDLPEPEPASPGAAGPFEDALLAEQRKAIQRALEELPEASRRALELSFFEGLSHREIADRLGDPLGTVKTRIRQGLLALRKVLRALRSEP